MLITAFSHLMLTASQWFVVRKFMYKYLFAAHRVYHLIQRPFYFDELHTIDLWILFYFPFVCIISFVPPYAFGFVWFCDIFNWMWRIGNNGNVCAKFKSKRDNKCVIIMVSIVLYRMPAHRKQILRFWKESNSKINSVSLFTTISEKMDAVSRSAIYGIT